jgi:hypothetical protein
MAITKVINDLIDLNATDATKSLKMPKGAAYSGTADPGMVRNSSETGSQGSANVMQHFNGTDWKNYENLPNGITTDFLVVAGGGAGGKWGPGGGGGAGGLKTTTKYGGTESTLGLSLSTAYTVTVGPGGIPASNGTDSSFSGSFTGSPITSTGGGRGAGDNSNNYPAAAGGSGGGGSGEGGGTGNGAGTLNQGKDGGTGYAVSGGRAGGGGGGAVAVGANATTNGGNGGSGLEANIIGGTGNFYAGGGGGATQVASVGTGGSGGGGAGVGDSVTTSINGTLNTGGGGGGGGSNSAGGGSGVVILRYPTASVASYQLDASSGLDTTADTAYPIANTAYYKLEGGSGTTVTDSSGNGNNGVSTSVTYAAGRFGQAAVFNGSSSNIALPFFTFVSGSSANFTASLWFNVTDMSSSNNLIQLSGSSATNSSFNVQLLSDGTFRIDSYGVGYAFTGLATVSTNNWYNLVLVNAGGTCTPYLNGSAGNVLTHNIGFSGSYSNLGSRYVLGSLYTLDITTGSIDQVRIFNSAISAGNVTSLYNESTVIPSTDGTDSILQFIGGTGTVTFS